MFGVMLCVDSRLVRCLPRLRTWVACLSCIVVMLAFAFAPMAIAKPTGAANIQVALPPSIEIRVGGDAPLLIDLTPRGSVPSRAIILIKGLPPSISLNRGRQFGSGVWGVPVANIEELRI